MVRLKSKQPVAQPSPRPASPSSKSTAAPLKRIISFDVETTGTDFRHGTRPYFATSACSEDPLAPLFWQWRVDPLTRKVIVPPDEADEVWDHIRGADQIVMQNGKFDVTAMASLHPRYGNEWPWGKTDDTMVMSHLLGSNHKKDLTTLGIRYLDLDITPYEEACHKATEQARRYCRSRLKDWRLAKKGLEDMPGAKGACWKADMWLPRALIDEVGLDAINEHYEEDLSWWLTVLQEYANADSVLTLALLPRMMDLIRDRKLDKIYNLKRRKLFPLTYKMESRGVTISKDRLDKLYADYRDASEVAEKVCIGIAADRGYELNMPKGASVNHSLRDFCFDVLGLEKIYNPKARGEDPGPTLDSKNAIPYYLDVLPPKSAERLFIKTLAGKRSRDTACTFMEMYQKFWVEVPGEPGWYRLHPNFKPCATDTLRWGCDNPAVQNISKRENFNLRYCFGPAPGREWWSLDAKNIELRLPFYESGEQTLIDLFEAPDEPPFYGSNHILNFSVIYPDLWEDALRKQGPLKVAEWIKSKDGYKSTWYSWCKNGNFAIQYGAVDKAGGGGTADRAFHKIGAHAMLKSRFKNLEVLNKACIAHASKYGYVETIPDRTVDPERGYPLLCTRTEYGKILETVPLSYRIQGSAMWWTSKGQMRCQEQLDHWQSTTFDGFITMQIHDEIVFDMPKSQIDPATHAAMTKKGQTIPLFERHKSNWWRVQKLADLMSQGGRDFITPRCPNGIPTPVGIAYHTDNWSEEVTLA